MHNLQMCNKWTGVTQLKHEQDTANRHARKSHAHKHIQTSHNTHIFNNIHYFIEVGLYM